ncbi:hypothetical protein BGW41_005659 [Actinomortierella wolfii]|nr:hypothetical protein BGW41_005659 [Actinomortierella wolfii]
MVKLRRPQFEDSPAAAPHSNTDTNTNTNRGNEAVAANGSTQTATAGAPSQGQGDSTTDMQVDGPVIPPPSTSLAVGDSTAETSSSMEVDTPEKTSEPASSSSAQPKSGPRPITMDAYQQLQQKRLRDQKTATPNTSATASHGASAPLDAAVQQFQVPSILDPSSAPSPASKAKAEESADALAHLQHLVSQIPALATNQTTSVIEATSGQQQTLANTSSGTAALPGPDLTRIIFAGTASAAAAQGGGQATSATTPSNGSSHHPKIPNGGSTNQSSHYHKTSSSSSSSVHRRSMTGGSGGVSSSSSSQPSSSSQYAAGQSSTSTNTRQQQPHKSPRAIHAIELIRISGEILQLPPTTIGTALIYYHKYRAYLHQALRRGDKDNEAFKADEYLFATACLHLACKCTEVSRKVRDLVNVTYRVMNPSQPVLSLSSKAGAEEAAAAAAVEQAIAAAMKSQAGTGTAGDGSQLQSQPPHHTFPVFPNAPPPTVTTYWHIRDSLLTTELMLLRILQFDLDVPLPFNDILRIFKGMGSIFEPSDEEAAQLYPNASSFDVFLPNLIAKSHHRNQSPKGASGSTHSPLGSASASNTLSPSSSSPHIAGASSPPASGGSLEPFSGIHPALSAMVQMAMTFCIDALCSSAIALHYSSRAMALGATYLAIRAVGLELPMPFEEWCYAWGRPSIVQAFGVDQQQFHYNLTNGRGGSLMISNGGPGTGSPRMGQASGTAIVVPGDVEMSTGSNATTSAGTTTTSTTIGGSSGGASHLSSTTLFAPPPPGSFKRPPSHGQTVGDGASKTGSPTSASDSPQPQATGSSPRPPSAPLTIVEEVQRVVQELTSFYNH